MIFLRGNMTTIEYLKKDNYEQLSQTTAQLIIDYVGNNPESLLCMAGGDTPIGTYKVLVEAHLKGIVDFSKCKFIGLDEWVGLDPKEPGSCRSYLQNHLFNPMQIKEENIVFFNSISPDLQSELDRINSFLEVNGPIDISLLGVGVNGHLGFNEPYSNIDENAHIVNLDETTQEVGKKYFGGESTKTKGITLGLKQLLQSNLIIVVASHSSKMNAINALKKGEYLPEIPVTALNVHPNCFIVTAID
ncbi:MAG: glucosamine-6-phosphate deaminase [Bacillales bacterium]|jgi:glucosamine-6-phosphate deaminase|nr:glucosamine-6-phosphate deaminase [Bacillales bacterium]